MMYGHEEPRSKRARVAFATEFGRSPQLIVSAPGRVNLIGEHTDYNGGFVLPTAIVQRTHLAFAPREDREVHVRSIAVGERASYQLGHEHTRRSFIDYVQGVTQAARVHGLELTGFDALVSSEIPMGGGLASSAALEIALLRALRSGFRWTIDDIALAKLAQWGENNVVGAPVGLLDPLACHLADTETALFIDTRTLVYQRYPLPAAAELVLIDSGVRHDHATGNYAKRRAECEAAARALGVSQLRDVSESELATLDKLEPPLDRRARHVVTENARVLRAVLALQQSDAVTLGELFNASHASMRDDFEVSIGAVDRIVAQAQALDDVFGARLTGGGFGGAVVCLVRKGSAAAVAPQLARDGAKQLLPMP